MSFITWSEKVIKSKINVGERVGVVENIKYPFFETSLEGKNKKLCAKMNEFYGLAAQKYSGRIRTTLVKSVARKGNLVRLPVNAGMKCAVTFADDNIISVVLDLYVGNGDKMKMKRFSQMWSIQTGNIIPVCEFVRTGKTAKRKILSNILISAKENAKNPSFGYYDNFMEKLKHNLSIANCFVVPAGIAFFVQPGKIRPTKYGATVFVLPKSALDGIINNKIYSKNSENSSYDVNIVNNV